MYMYISMYICMYMYTYMRCSMHVSPPAGLKPAIFGSEVRRLVH